MQNPYIDAKIHYFYKMDSTLIISSKFSDTYSIPENDKEIEYLWVAENQDGDAEFLEKIAGVYPSFAELSFNLGSNAIFSTS